MPKQTRNETRWTTLCPKTISSCAYHPTSIIHSLPLQSPLLRYHLCCYLPRPWGWLDLFPHTTSLPEYCSLLSFTFPPGAFLPFGAVIKSTKHPHSTPFLDFSSFLLLTFLHVLPNLPVHFSRLPKHPQYSFPIFHFLLSFTFFAVVILPFSVLLKTAKAPILFLTKFCFFRLPFL